MSTPSHSYRFTDDPAARDEVARLLSERQGSTFQFRHYRIRTAVAMFGAGMAAIVFTAAIVRILQIPHGIAVWLVFAAAIAGVYLWRLYTMHANRRMAEEAEAGSALIEGETLWEMTPEGLKITNAVSESYFRWAAFDTILKGTTGLGLGSGSIFFVIPTAAIGSADEVEALCQQIAGWSDA